MPDFYLHFCCESDEELYTHKLEHTYKMNLHAVYAHNYTLVHKSRSVYDLHECTYSSCVSSSSCINVYMGFWDPYFNDVSHEEKS